MGTLAIDLSRLDELTSEEANNLLIALVREWPLLGEAAKTVVVSGELVAAEDVGGRYAAFTFHTKWKVGVYMHDTYGPFEGLQAARSAAQNLAMADIDSHHSYDVSQMDRTGLSGDFGSYRKFDKRSELRATDEGSEHG